MFVIGLTINNILFGKYFPRACEYCLVYNVLQNTV